MKKYKILYFIILLHQTFFISCSKMDEYKEYVNGGELVYPTKIDSLQILSGKNRVMIQGVVKVNRGMTSYRVFWNDRQDSVIVPVKLTDNVDTLRSTINDLQEGTINFEIRSYDDKGNVSVPTYLVGNVYGERFREGLFQRSVMGVDFDKNGNANINLQDVSKDMGFYAVKLNFKNSNNQQVDTVILTENISGSVVLKDYLLGGKVNYTTVYRPEPNSIDTFLYDDYTEIPLIGDVSEMFLKNYKKPFFPSDYDNNRWGSLLDWDANDAAKNQTFNGIWLGGYASDDGGIVKLETGWNDAREIKNGKIYQKITLPAGKYRFSTNVIEDAWDGDVPGFLIVNKGDQLSDYDNIYTSTHLGSEKLTSGEVSFDFTISTKELVSLGFILNMDSYKWLAMEYFKLESL